MTVYPLSPVLSFQIFIQMALALLLIVLPGSPYVFVVCVIVISLLALYWLFVFVFDGACIRFTNTLAMSILLGYGAGSLVFLIGNSTIDVTTSQFWSADGLWYDQYSVSRGLAICLMASVVLGLGSAFEPPASRMLNLNLGAPTKANRIVVVTVVIVAAALLKGDLGYKGAVAADGEGLSALGSIANLLVPAVTPLVVLMMFAPNTRSYRWLLLVVLVFLVMTLFIMGRRDVLFTMVLSLAALMLVIGRLNRRTLLLLLFGGVISLLFVYLGFQVFYAIRLALRELNAEDATVWDALRLAPDYLYGSKRDFAADKLSENVASRPFILSYFAVLLGTESNQVPTLGLELLHGMIIATPSAVFPDKNLLIPAAPEELIHPLYGFHYFDGPNSIVVAGYDDFGWAGAVLYPVALALIFAAYFRVLSGIVKNSALRVIAFFAILFQLLYIEQALSEYIVMVRNLTIVAGMMWIVLQLPRVTLRGARALHGSSRSKAA